MRLIRWSLLILIAIVVQVVAMGEKAAKPPPATVAPGCFTNVIGMKLVRILPGSYVCYGRDIKPEFLFPKPKGFAVKLDSEFYLGAMEVTQKQYQKIMRRNPSDFKQCPDCPVNRVSWDEAMEFCRKLSELPAEKAAGRVYALPTEREWQYAARAGSEFLFPYGGDDEQRIAEVAVCRDIYTDSMPQRPERAGTRKPNAWGLYDTLGNVWEWTLDACPTDASPAAVTPSASAAASDQGANRVIVGGGWDNDFRMCNLAARYSAPPTRKANNIGFRVRCRIVPSTANR